MRAQSVHFYVLTVVLALAGLALTAYQVFSLHLPLTEQETDNLWVIDARVQYEATGPGAVKLRMFIPPLERHYVALNESFVSKDYGINIDSSGANRLLTWSARRARGQQTLYYRLNVATRFGAAPPAAEGPVYRAPMMLEPIEVIAVETLLEPIRKHSADIETFISEAIQRLSRSNDEHVKVLLQDPSSLTQKVDALERLLSVAHIPIERVHILDLDKPSSQQLELWIRSYNGTQWLYFNPATGSRGLPENRLVWWYGDQPLFQLEGGRNPRIDFTINQSAINAMRLGQLSSNAQSTISNFLDFSLYGLPLAQQQVYQLIIMIPLGVLFILLLRNLIGLQTLGTFRPVLIGLAFRETGLAVGVVFFIVITALGLMVRGYLEYLKLQLLPRLSVVLTFVVMLMAGISLLTHKLGMESGLSVSLFPMVILTMTIERLSITWDERGGNTAFKQGVITLFAAAGTFYLMNLSWLKYFIFTFPGTLLIMVAIMLLMGRYRGYRLSEIIRFRALAESK